MICAFTAFDVTSVVSPSRLSCASRAPRKRVQDHDAILKKYECVLSLRVNEDKQGLIREGCMSSSQGKLHPLPDYHVKASRDISCAWSLADVEGSVVPVSAKV